MKLVRSISFICIVVCLFLSCSSVFSSPCCFSSAQSSSSSSWFSLSSSSWFFLHSSLLHTIAISCIPYDMCGSIEIWSYVRVDAALWVSHRLAEPNMHDYFRWKCRWVYSLCASQWHRWYVCPVSILVNIQLRQLQSNVLEAWKVCGFYEKSLFDSLHLF